MTQASLATDQTLPDGAKPVWRQRLATHEDHDDDEDEAEDDRPAAAGASEGDDTEDRPKRWTRRRRATKRADQCSNRHRTTD